jgi:flagellin
LAADDVILFSGLATTELSDPSTGAISTDRSLAEAIYNPNLTAQAATPQQATAAFQVVQRTANNFVLELGRQRAFLGAAMNQMDYTLQNITDLASNLEQARSRVIDTDYASETAALTRGQILQQAATAMLAQANQMPNVILTLLK